MRCAGGWLGCGWLCAAVESGRQPGRPFVHRDAAAASRAMAMATALAMALAMAMRDLSSLHEQ